MEALTRSDWIALIACAGTCLGLIYPFRQMLCEWKEKQARLALEVSTQHEKIKPEESKRKNIGPLMRALVLTAMAFTFFIVELVAFSWLASLLEVPFNFSTMPTNWIIGFIAILFVPGMLLLLAMYHFSAAFSD